MMLPYGHVVDISIVSCSIFSPCRGRGRGGWSLRDVGEGASDFIEGKGGLKEPVRGGGGIRGRMCVWEF